MKNVLVLGSGAREHSICEKLALSEEVREVFVFPGNDLMESENITKVNINNTFDDILGFCIHREIEFVIPSTETYLCDGIVDFLEKNNVKCFGPDKKNSFLEGSKIYSKALMDGLKINNPSYKIFKNFEEALNYIKTKKDKSYVIKNPNLAGGKGVFLPENLEKATDILKSCFYNLEEVIIEQRVFGEEVSILGFCNGEEISLMPQTKDYKKINDGEKGLNTGGMGAYGPVEILSKSQLNYVKQKMELVVKELNYKGVLYGGIMKSHREVYFLEFNCRFGDPETQVILNLLESDLFKIMKNCRFGEKIEAKWSSDSCLNLVLSHLDYPVKNSNSPLEIDLKKLDKSVKMYSGNLKKIENKVFSQGGRILNLLSKGDNPVKILSDVFRNARNLTYKDKYFRKDVGLPLLSGKNLKNVNIAILGSGKGTCTQKLLQKAHLLGISVKIIISNRKNSEILEKARNLGFSFLFLDPKNFSSREKYDKALVDTLKILDVDLVVLAGYMRILTKPFIESFGNKSINVHPSLLPNFSGLMDMEVHRKVINSKEKISGCTFHYVTEDVDKGEIILQKQYHLQKNETPESLKREIQNLEKDGLIEAINICRSFKKSYKSSGVDIDEGNKVVELIKNISPELEKDIGFFGSNINIKDLKISASTDGVGSKLEIAMDLEKFDTIGIDLVAMVVNDLYCCGAKPLFFLDYIAMEKVIPEKCESLIRGIQEGCKISNCRLIGGETAEMPSIYYKDKFDLAGFGVGVIENNFPKDINKGDLIYGIKSSGVHSNGYSLVRNLLKTSSYSLEELLTPTRIYYEIPEIISKYKDSLLGICHITGGGIKENLPRLLKKGLDFSIKDWDFPDVFKWIQKESQMTKDEMLRTFNCGYGMVLIFKKDSQVNEFEYLGEIV